MRQSIMTARASPFPSAEDKDRERQMKREAVMRTAASMFCERGYTATQMSDVASELGVTKPTIYYYFKNKEDVLVACFEAGFEMIQSTLNREGEAAKTGAERLHDVLVAYSEILTQDYGKCTARISTADLSEESRERVSQQKRRFDDQVRSLFRDAVEDGSIPPCDIKIATFTVLSSLNGIGRWYKPDGDLSPEQVAQAVVDQLFKGIGWPRHA